jgi:chorismate mutase
MVANAAQNTKREAQFIERVHQQTNNHPINSPLPKGDVFKDLVGKIE